MIHTSTQLMPQRWALGRDPKINCGCPNIAPRHALAEFSSNSPKFLFSFQLAQLLFQIFFYFVIFLLQLSTSKPYPSFSLYYPLQLIQGRFFTNLLFFILSFMQLMRSVQCHIHFLLYAQVKIINSTASIILFPFLFLFLLQVSLVQFLFLFLFYFLFLLIWLSFVLEICCFWCSGKRSKP